jgi:hypothetical protein
MIEGLIVFLTTATAQFWIPVLVFTGIFGPFISIPIWCWWDSHKQKKLEANPHRMDEGEMRCFNRERFKK